MAWGKKHDMTSFRFFGETFKHNRTENVNFYLHSNDCMLVPQFGCYIITFNAFFYKFVSSELKSK